MVKISDTAYRLEFNLESPATALESITLAVASGQVEDVHGIVVPP